MIAARLAEPDDFESWRTLARAHIIAGMRPQDIAWSDGDAACADMFATAQAPDLPETQGGTVRASRAFLDLARSALLHRDPARLDLLYRLLWRLQQRPRLIEDAADSDVRNLQRLAAQVRRDIHKMRAFVRFRSLEHEDGGERFVAWFEPDHRIERANARFFVDRFGSQRWSILTPRLSLHWDGAALSEGPPASRDALPQDDAAEELWLGYYRSIFNPARLKVGAMLKEMPRRFWKNLPEARQIPDLIAGAQAREVAMIAGSAPLPEAGPPDSLNAVAAAIATCRRCAIGCNGTQGVAGEGPADARTMMIGEQPGDTEEREARPFVGPAGQLLDSHLAAIGFDRSRAFVTNAVKHFKFKPTGKRRLHQNPTAGEIDHCRWWLDSERALVRPRAILALGASAGRGVLGRTPAIGRERGRAHVLDDGTALWLTAHPSYLLRLDGEARAREEERFRADLQGFVELCG
ncbi:UdgX family uracil-DNA binding protein [Novosphingobium colocasiae]|uniref:Type-4 uracil-DNA glycosylase n=1 Tax=Novosphingobium colocasiae TaxID=1256513 RepID=A0A918UJ16_9SPHN|nr:UdgX family uracil-DNA binding protein [Novosphingobium colocasiae]GGZ13959.1 uracil-DNA glycosylase [Novosphingobium colocasiae]